MPTIAEANAAMANLAAFQAMYPAAAQQGADYVASLYANSPTQTQYPSYQNLPPSAPSFVPEKTIVMTQPVQQAGFGNILSTALGFMMGGGGGIVGGGGTPSQGLIPTALGAVNQALGGGQGQLQSVLLPRRFLAAAAMPYPLNIALLMRRPINQAIAYQLAGVDGLAAAMIFAPRRRRRRFFRRNFQRPMIIR